MKSLFILLLSVLSAKSHNDKAPPTTSSVSTSSTSNALGIRKLFDQDSLPLDIIDLFKSSKDPEDIANVGDSVELECEASDTTNLDPSQGYPDHDMGIEIILVGAGKRDLSASGWWIDVETAKKRRPSKHTGRIDITERARIYMYKDSVTQEDSGFYACRACIYRGTEHEKCDGRMLLLKVVDENKPQEEPAATAVQLPRSTCQVFGDPQVLTFDQHFYRLPASSCDYILALDAAQVTWFIYGRSRPCGNQAAGFCLAAVTVYTQDDMVELQRGWLINYHGQKIETRDLAGEREIGPFRASFLGTNLQIAVLLGESVGEGGEKEEDWLVVGWDGFTAVTIQAPRTTRTAGACGNNDQDPDNDFYRYGQANYDVTTFADSLQVLGRQGCEPGTEPLGVQEVQEICGEDSHAEYYFAKAQKRCNKIFSSPQFEYCFTDKRVYIEACIYDECKGFNIRNTLYPWMVIPQVDRLLRPGCAAAEAYAYKCSGEWWDLEGATYARVAVEGWEGDTCPSPEEKKLNIPRMGCPQSFMPEVYDNIN